MKTLQKRIILILALFLSFSGYFAQSAKLSIDNVYSVTLRNSGSIIENEEIKGYYFFYQSDKMTNVQMSTPCKF